MTPPESPFGNGPEDLSTPIPSRAPAGGPLKGEVELGPISPTVVNAPKKGEAPSQIGDFDSLLNKINGDQGAAQMSPQEAYKSTDEFHGGAPLQVQQKASQYASPEAKAAVYNQFYGKNSARVDGDDVYIKKPGQDHYERASATTTDVLGKLASGDLPGAFQAAGSVAASNAGGLENVAKNAGAMIAGGAAGSLLFPGMGTVTGAAMALGSTLGSSAQTYMSTQDQENATNELLGRKPLPGEVVGKASDAAMMDAALNTSFSVGGALLNRTAKGVQKALQDMPTNQALAMRQLQGLVDDYAKVWGSPSLAETGKAVKGSLDKQSADLKNYITKYDTIVSDMASKSNQKVPVDHVLEDLQKIAKTQGVEFGGQDGLSIVRRPQGVKAGIEPSGPKSSTPASVFDDMMDNLPDETVRKINERMGIERTVPKMFSSEEDRGPIFSDYQSGKKTLETVLGLYNDLLDAKRTHGGLTVDALRSYDKAWGKLSSYDPTKEMAPAPLSKAIARQIDHSFGETRDAFYGLTLHGTEYENDFAKDWQTYKDKKDAIKSLSNAFGDKGMAPEMMINKAINTNDPRAIRALKVMFGEDNPKLMASLRGAFLQHCLLDATELGRVNFGKLASNIRSISPLVSAELFDKTEERQLQAFVNVSKSFMEKDFKPSDGAISMVRSAFNLLTGAVTLNVPKMATTLYAWFGNNEKAYKLLTDAVLPAELEAAKQSRNFIRIQNTSKLIDKLSDFRTLSQTVKLGSREILVPLPAFREVLKESSKQALGSMQKSNVKLH